MSTKAAVVLILVSAAVAGGSAAVALKPAVKPQQTGQVQQVQQPAPQRTTGNVAQGIIPPGPGVPPALAGRPWVGAGGNLGPWWGYDQITQKMVKNLPNTQSIQGNLVFPDLPPTAKVWYFPDPNPAGPVYYTVGSPDTN